MTDIVERLQTSPCSSDIGCADALCAEAADEITRLRAQLPEGMQDRRIIFEECEVGHGFLRGENWVKHKCPWCQITRLSAENERLRKDVIWLINDAVEQNRAALKGDSDADA